MTTSADLRALAVTGLTGTTDAGANVFSPRDWPTWDGDYPVIFVLTPTERGVGLGPNGPPQFTTTTTLQVVARVQIMAQALDAGAAAALVALEDLNEQIKRALINYSPLMALLQQFPSFTSQMQVSDENGRHLGELTFALDMEYYQGPDDFCPIPGVPLAGFDVAGSGISTESPGISLQGLDVTVQAPTGTSEPFFSINYPQ